MPITITVQSTGPASPVIILVAEGDADAPLSDFTEALAAAIPTAQPGRAIRSVSGVPPVPERLVRDFTAVERRTMVAFITYEA